MLSPGPIQPRARWNETAGPAARSPSVQAGRLGPETHGCTDDKSTCRALEYRMPPHDSRELNSEFSRRYCPANSTELAGLPVER